MAREYIRPDLPRQLLRELVPSGVVLLINPTLEELIQALSGVQKRRRTSLLSEDKVRELYEDSLKNGFSRAWASSAKAAPANYGYDYPSTQVAACRLGEGLIGYAIVRSLTPPGHEIAPPLFCRRAIGSSSDPLAWRNSIIETFWTRLTDPEIAAIDQAAIEQAMVIAVRQKEAQRAHRKQLRDSRRVRAEAKARREKQEYDLRVMVQEQLVRGQLNSLFKGAYPEYSTHVAEACAGIAAKLAAEGREAVAWGEFKKIWPSIADRYREDLLPLIENGRLTVASLRNVQGTRPFSLSFDLWTGSQRIFEVPQIVFRIEARELLARQAKSDANMMNIIDSLLKQNRQSLFSHPVREWTVGWLRVHIDDENRIVFVDEVQSDTLERIRDMAEKYPVAARELERILRPWSLHGFASVCRWARAIGYDVGLHSRESSARKPGMTHSERKWNQYYEPVIKQFGLSAQSVKGYPAPIMTNRVCAN